jgi:hypothetical protein
MGLSILLARGANDHGFLDRVDLVSHEAGHLLFSWFGEFLTVIGGTIGQLFVPAAFTAYFFLRRELTSATVTLFWAGQNFLNISVYVKDAQAMALPLVSIGGGEDAIHDWNYLLSAFGLLRYDQTIGSLVHALGLLVMIASVLAGLYLSLQGEDTA